MTNTASLNAVRSALDTTLQQAQTALEVFAGDRSNINEIQQCTDLINQARGIFLVIEDQGAALLTEEAINLLNKLPIENQGEAVDDAAVQKQLEALSGAMVVLNRYLEYLALNAHDIKVLLLPSINEIRKARGVTALRESHFFNFKVEPKKPRVNQVFKFDAKVVKAIRGYRHMYQAAFLYLLKGQRSRGALKYMAQAVSRIDKIAGNTQVAPLFWVAASALESLGAANAHMDASRKLLLAQLDREIRQLIKRGEPAFATLPSPVLLKDFLYLISLSGAKSSTGSAVKSAFNLPDLPISEEFLNEQRELMFSPGNSVINSVSEALKEDIDAVKQLVDSAARGGPESDFSAKKLHQALQKIADILVMVGLPSPSKVLKQQANIVGGWADRAAPQVNELLNIADAVLYAESAMARVNSSDRLGDQDGKATAAKAELHQARLILIDESESGLAMAKRAISAFMDSRGDKLHLNNILSTLDAVRGALIFLEIEGADKLVSICMNFIDKRLLQEGNLPTEEQLEAFADGVSSLEFLLEGLLSSNKADNEVLKLARESLVMLESA